MNLRLERAILGSLMLGVEKGGSGRGSGTGRTGKRGGRAGSILF